MINQPHYKKVFDMLKDIDVKFGKKKKEKDRTTTRKRKLDAVLCMQGIGQRYCLPLSNAYYLEGHC